MSSFCITPDRVGIVVGNHRYRCQERKESDFRSYSREHAADFTSMEPIQTIEDNAIAQIQRDLATGSAPTKRLLAFDIHGPEDA